MMSKNILLIIGLVASFNAYSQTCTVNSGAPLIICENESLSLNGSASIVNGDPSSVLWTLISQPAGANAIINTPNRPKSNLSGVLVAGNYTFQIQQNCSDGSGTPTQQVTHTIIPLPTSAVLPADITIGCYDGTNPIMITGNNAAAGESVSWSVVGGEEGELMNASTPDLSFTPQVNQSTCTNGAYHTTTLRYTISNSNCSSNDEITIAYYYTGNDFYTEVTPNISCGNPCVDLYGSCPLDGTGTWTYTGPGNVTFTDANAPITQACADRDGTYIFTWTMSNSCYAGMDSDTLVINGLSEGIITTDAGLTQQYCTYPSAIALNATPLENGQTAYWTQTSGAMTTINDPFSPSTMVSGLVTGAGPYTFLWQVQGTECGASDTVSIREKPIITGYNDMTTNCYFSDPPQLQAGTIFNFDRVRISDLEHWEINITPTAIPQQLQVANGGRVEGILYAYLYENESTTTVCGFSYGQIPFGTTTTGANLGITESFIIDSTYIDNSYSPDCNGDDHWISIFFQVDADYQYAGDYNFDISVTNSCATYTFDATANVNLSGNTIPNAGTDAILPCGIEQTQLSGNQLDGDRGVWSLLSGPSNPLNIDNRYEQSPIINNLLDGVYTFRYSYAPSDGACTFTYDDVRVLVNHDPPDPVSITFTPPNPCTDGPAFLSANIPPTAMSGTWTQIIPASPSVIFHPDANSKDVTITGLQANTNYEFQWEVSNACGSSNTTANFTTNNNQGPSLAVITTDDACRVHFGGAPPSVQNASFTATNPTSGTGVWTIISEPSGASSTLNASNNQVTINNLVVDGIYGIEWAISVASCSTVSRDTAYVYRTIFNALDAGSNLEFCDISLPFTTYLNAEMDDAGIYSWQLLSGPAPVIFDDAYNHNAAITFNEAGSYTLEWTGSDICNINNDQITIKIAEDPIVSNAGTDITNCETDGVFNLNASNTPSNYTGNWTIESTTGGSINIADTNDPQTTATLSEAGQAILHWNTHSSVAYCSPVPDDIILTWLAADAGEDQSFCDAAIGLLYGNESSFANVQWTQLNGPNTALIESPNESISLISNLTPGVYEFEYSISFDGCTSTDVVFVTIDDFIAANAGEDQSFCDNAIVNLMGNTPSQGTSSWHLINGPNTGIFSDANSVNTTYGPLNPDSTYVFQYNITNNNCQSNDVVFVYPLSNNTTFATTSATCGNADGAIDLTVNGSGNPSLTYLWSNGATTEDLNNVSAGIYSVTISHPDGCSTVAEVGLPSADGPLIILDDIYDVCPNETGIDLISVISGGSNYSYLWNTGATTSFISVDMGAADTSFILQVTDINTGCVTTKTATLFYKSAIEISLPNDTIICNDPIDLTINFDNYPDTLITIADLIQFDNFETDLGTWTQDATDDNDWIRNTGTTPSNNTGPSNGANNSDYYLYLEANLNSNESSILTSQVFDLNSNSNFFLDFYYHMYGFSTGSLAVDVSIDNGATWVNEWTLSGNQGDRWYNQLLDLSTYAGNTSVQVRFVGTIGSFSSSDIAIDHISLGTTPRMNYLWSTGATTESISIDPASVSMEQTYSITVTDNWHNCTATDEILIAPTPDLTAQNATICTGDFVNLDTLVSDAVAPNIAASFHSDTPPSSSNQLANPIVAPNTTTTYYVYKGNSTCNDTESITLTVNNAPDLMTRDTTICTVENVDLAILATDTNNTGQTISYHSALPADVSNELASSTVSPNVTTTYYTYIINASCTDVDSIIVNAEICPCTQTFCLPVDVVKN